VEVQFNGQGWILHRMQWNSVVMSPKQLRGNNLKAWGQATSTVWLALQLQSWDSLPLPCGHCFTKGDAWGLQKGSALLQPHIQMLLP